jgi:serine/threonine protein kinase
MGPEIDGQQAAKLPCYGNGVCIGSGEINPPLGAGTCICDANWDVAADCNDCAAGFFNTTCEPCADACDPEYGICIASGSNAEVAVACECNPDFALPGCFERCPFENGCSGHGTCLSDLTCNCDVSLDLEFSFAGAEDCGECGFPFYGATCNLARNCGPDGGMLDTDTICNGRGVCSIGISGTGTCECDPGYVGLACELEASSESTTEGDFFIAFIVIASCGLLFGLVYVGRAYTGRKSSEAALLNRLTENMTDAIGLDKGDRLMDAFDNDPKNWIISPKDVEIGPLIGRGSSGAIFKGTYSDQDVAIKRLFIDNTSKALSSNVELEASLLARLQHPNIVRFFGICATKDVFLIITELCDGTLWDYICKQTKYGSSVHSNYATLQAGGGGVVRTDTADSTNNSSAILKSLKGNADTKHYMRVEQSVQGADIYSHIDEGGVVRGDVFDGLSIPSGLSHKVFYRIATSITNGVVFLHSRGVIHRDLKPTNILLVDTRDSEVVLPKLCDFGLSHVRRKRESTKASDGDATMQSSHAGTLSFTAPEFISGKSGDPRDPETGYLLEKGDVYSFGITLWAMWTGTMPYEDTSLGLANQYQLGIAVVRGVRPTAIRDDNSAFATGLQSLMRDCWQDDPTKRPSFQDIRRELKCIMDRKRISPQQSHQPDLRKSLTPQSQSDDIRTV